MRHAISEVLLYTEILSAITQVDFGKRRVDAELALSLKGSLRILRIPCSV